MHIVIVGEGKVGFALTQQLSREGHDLVVIDNRPAALRQSDDVLDVFTVEGNGASYAVHEDAHIRITALIGKLSGGRRRGMDLVVLTLWLLFALWLTVEGCVLVGKIAAMGQVSSAMRIPMTIPYASVPIGGALMTIRLVQKIVERLRNTQEEEA